MMDSLTVGGAETRVLSLVKSLIRLGSTRRPTETLVADAIREAFSDSAALRGTGEQGLR
ncbi:hypothetical protein [Cohnella nanjingensis]|uniref:Uncharacterized protein n=1 Tax=Cohnella nanjingensis TaxID=1387779 RepID=A0A7X0RWV8_9BACL|nr:hypothetical protein [Cohnella nanjingensis]MBB6675167.1 hypothetical protein [Cohnella nanjingensis]